MQKRIISPLAGIFLLFIFCCLILSSSGAYAEDDAMSNMTPSAPPSLPSMDYSTAYNQFRIAPTFSYLKIENVFQDKYDLYMITTGSLFTYIGALSDKTGYSYSAGFLYQYMDDSYVMQTLMEGDAFIFPFAYSLAYRLSGTPDSSNTILFAGVNILYMNMTYKTESGDADFWSSSESIKMETTLSGFSYGLLCGVKSKFKISEIFSIIPYGGIQATASSLSYSTSVSGSGSTSGSADSDPISSVIFGFDLEFYGFSIGTMLDALSSSDGNKITVNIGYTYRIGENAAEDTSLQPASTDKNKKKKDNGKAKTVENSKTEKDAKTVPAKTKK